MIMITMMMIINMMILMMIVLMTSEIFPPQVLTINEKEKVRYVKFDSVGHQIVTGTAI